jgi:hypothetical protein
MPRNAKRLPSEVTRDLSEALHETAALDWLTVQQRDGFGMLPRTRKPEAEVRLGALQRIGRTRERTTEQPTERGTDARIQKRERHHVSGYLYGRTGHHHRPRHRPQDLNEEAEAQHRIDEGVGETERTVGRDANVLGDALVGIVVLARAEEQPVMAAVLHPAAHQEIRQPSPPIELQPALHEQVRRGDGDRDYEDQRKHLGLEQHVAN